MRSIPIRSIICRRLFTFLFMELFIPAGICQLKAGWRSVRPYVAEAVVPYMCRRYVRMEMCEWWSELPLKEEMKGREICCHYWLCRFLCSPFTQIKDEMSCVPLYITSRQINWLKHISPLSILSCFLLLLKTIFGFHFNKQIMQHVHWIVTHKHNWTSFGLVFCSFGYVDSYLVERR